MEDMNGCIVGEEHEEVEDEVFERNMADNSGGSHHHVSH